MQRTLPFPAASLLGLLQQRAELVDVFYLF
jgi:hypothetical protein